MKYCPITRRMFLKGLGGYALSVPLLPSLLSKAYANTQAPSLRFAMILGKLGRDMSQWYPNIPPNQMNAVSGGFAMPLSQISKPISYCIGSSFDPVLNKMSLIRGLDSMSTQGNHNASLPTTGSSLDPKSSVGFGYSIDCVLEESKKFYPNIPNLGALRTCPDISHPYHEFASFSWTSKTVQGQLINPEWNPQDVYNRILNPAGIQATNAKNGRLRSVTDLVTENFKQVMNGRAIGSEDKLRLDNYMHSIAHSGDTFEPMWHQYAHGGEYSVNPSTGRSYLSEYCKYNMDLVAYFLTEMDRVSEPNGGTLLDNTFFLYGNEDGTGSHEHFDLPVIVAGAKGKIRTGQFIDYRSRPFFPLISREKQIINAGRPYNSMLVTAFQALDLSPQNYQKFGQAGFGRYDKPAVLAGSYYNQFLGARVNDPLPYLYTG
jgi:hypothetical protein